MNDPTQHELDELLSAYLDDELSADERALVEQRLATDAAARQTLEQLRSVSQSLRDLPPQSVGHDLRESILQRAAAATAAKTNGSSVASDPRPSSLAPSSSLPAVTIGRTRRGWVWASIAIAAALLIMVFQPGSEEDAELPDLARTRNRALETQQPESGDRRRQLAESEPAAPIAAAPKSDIPAPAATEQSSSAKQSATLAESTSEGRVPDFASAPVASSRYSAVDGAAPPAAPVGEAEAKIAASPPASLPAASPPSIAGASPTTQPVVVHVLTNRAAFETKAFDNLLRENGVIVQPLSRSSNAKSDASGTIAAGESSAVSRRQESLATPAPAEESARVDGRAMAKPADAAADDFEVVLVDAPSNTILSCMDAVDKDKSNYLGVAIDELPPNQSTDADANKDAVAAEVPSMKESVPDLAKYNRGNVPRLHDRFSRETLYFDVGGSHYFYSAPSPGGGLGGFAGGGGKAETANEADLHASGRLHARQAQPQTFGAPSSVSGTIRSGGSPSFGVDKKLRTGTVLAAPADSERMQVMFVLQPSPDPAPSLKAKNPAE